MQFEYIDWYDVQELCEGIGAVLHDEFDAVIGVARGGVIPARIIADVIGVTRFGSISANHYSNETYGKYKQVFVADFKLAKDVKNILVVDDIYDTGDTLQAIGKILRDKKINVTFVTLLAKSPASKINGFSFVYGRLTKANLWSVFPWECQELNRVVGR